MIPPAVCMKRANGIMSLTPNGNEIFSSLSAAQGIRVMKNDVIALYSRGISSIFTAWIVRRIKLISKSITMICSIVLSEN
jgi:archaeosine-15-forming tRNA-guanine transglycosylase